jgi:DNA (cytosine-5)-methyltransferase 1
MSSKGRRALRAAEFFAGIGLVRLALEEQGFKVVFANDIETSKWAMYSANFRPANFVLGDVRHITGASVPDCELATASFPCTDLSLAGNRAGLNGKESGMFWEFARILKQMGRRRPSVILLENVTGFATSRNGKDLVSAIERLNDLGYICDIFTVDARWFVPQSRPRLFIVGSAKRVPEEDIAISLLRPEWIRGFIRAHPSLAIQSAPLSPPTLASKITLPDCIERLPSDHERWWDAERVARFIDSLSPIQSERLDAMRSSARLTWATTYRRTRQGRAVWEIRPDGISGCLRTAKGGSGRQAIVEVSRGHLRVRWMLPREYARLQGAPDFRLDGTRENDALSAFGDGVCVPVIAWITREYLRPLLEDTLTNVLPQKRLTFDYSISQISG